MTSCHVEEKIKSKNLKVLSQLQGLITYLNQMVIGQEVLVNRLIVALLADGHLLVEGAPGLAKTRAIKVLCNGLESSFHRVQFTPDLLPADLTGTEIYRMETGVFEFQKGPLFHNLILADEINRAPAKVQSALLEAMAERQITVGKHTYTLPKLFLVMATQNPIEQEGTYPLPEAQLDRFLLKVNVGYPDPEKEIEILNLVLNEARAKQEDVPLMGPKLTQDDIFAAREAVLDVFLGINIQKYIVELILATRNPGKYGADIGDWIQYGASPRAGISLARAAKALAFLQGSDFVGPEHVQALAKDVLCHRIILSYKAEAEGVTPEICIDELLARVAVP
ncbi:MAG: MoxR family ATPase [Chlamydiales bacterium]|nr:MoxR family ATPase [Chlamydiales bacterium]